MWELIPGLEPVMRSWISSNLKLRIHAHNRSVDTVFSEECSKVVDGKKCLITQVLSIRETSFGRLMAVAAT